MIFVVALLVCCFSFSFFLSSQLSSAFVVWAAGNEEERRGEGQQRDTVFVFTPFVAALLVVYPFSIHPCIIIFILN